jgi:hypothetical protein
MPSRPRFTIAGLMAIIALFGILFTWVKTTAAQPDQIGAMLGGSLVSAVIAWSAVTTLWRYLGLTDPLRRGPRVVAGLALTSLALDVTSWLLVAYFSSHFTGTIEPSWGIIGGWIAVVILGCIAFSLAAMAMKASIEINATNARFTTPLRLAATFAAATSCPFLLPVGIILVKVMIWFLRSI